MPNVRCRLCKKIFYAKPSWISYGHAKYCSQKCQFEARKNGKHVEYRNIMIKNGIKPMCKLCRKTDKRILCVHHKDRNRKNNSISNLVWLCYNCHHLVHNHKISV